MTMNYRLAPDRSQFTVHAFATGMLSVFAHSPTFDVQDFRGQVRLDDGAPGRTTLDVVVKSSSLVLLDHVRPADRREIEGRMREEVLEVFAYPELHYDAHEVSSSLTAPGQFRLRINGRLSLHGVTRPQVIEAEMRLFEDGLHFMGDFSLGMSEFQIKPVTALGGAIRLKDALKVSFQLVGLPEAT